MSLLATSVLVANAVALGVTSPVHAASAVATCLGSTGPGIPPPASLPGGISGFHAQWYGQSGYPTLCPGQRSTATVAYYNSGSLGWVSGRMGESAYLGTWGPEPGQLGGDGQIGSPATGWPRYNRIAIQPAPYVGPGQVAWFQFAIEPPALAGYYRLYLRPLVEGATGTGYSFLNVALARGSFGVYLIKERLAQVSVRTLTANVADCFADCPVKPLAQYVVENNAYAGMHGTYLCPPDYAACAGKVNSYEYAVYNSNLGGWLNQRAINSQNGLVTFGGGGATYYRRGSTYVQSGSPGPVAAAISNYPLLMQNGVVVDSEAEQSPSQMLRGTKGALGSDGTFIYLAIVTNASVTDTAFVLQALGVKDALNLDGGGTAAMYFGGAYKVGPGRLLPNALVLTKP